jgi:hypothetical protein
MLHRYGTAKFYRRLPLKLKLIPTTLLFLFLSLSVGAFAKTKSTDIEIYRPTQLAGTTLAPGTYKVAVDTTGSTAQVTFSRNGKQVATATGQVVQLATKSQNNAVVTNTSSSVPTIDEIDLEGLQTGVSFASAAATSASGE